MTRKDLAQMCRLWRERQGITQAQIADKARVSAQAVSKFETKGANSITIFCAYLDYGFKTDLAIGACLFGGERE